MKSFHLRRAPGPLAWLLGAALLPAGPARAQQPGAAPAVLGTTPPAAPVPTGPWTLQAAVDYAVAHNLDVGQSVLSARTSKTYLQQSKAALLPSANLNGSQVWNYGTNVNPLTYEFQSQTIRSNNFSAVSQVVLYQGFQLRNTVKRNALDYAATLGDIEKARNDLSLNVASQYLQLLLSEELIRSNQTRVASSQAQVDRTQILLKAGSVAESNLLDSQSQLASDELNVVTATNQRDIARLNLTQLMNLPPAAAAAFVADVPALPDPDDEALLALNVEDTYQTAAARLPEIRAAELRVQSAGRSLDLARGAYYPRLLLGGSVQTGFSSSATARQITGDSTVTALPVYQYNPANPGRPTLTNFAAIVAQPSVNYLPKGFFNQLNDNIGRTIQFSVSVPILNGLQVRNNVQRALINEDVARLRADQARLTLRQSIEQANADARAAQLQYIFAKRQVTALTTSQRNAEIRFNNGLLNGTDFNIAKNNLTAAESNRLQAKYTFIFRRKVLDFYLGKPLTL
ncbi:TolC family protein [Hymenobacter caeli]|uniref:Outer membrane protein n=1 Tax=Hymenobacter caeli TaxID=2735894 RepID=A0ABX2FR63_9BACT|nr:TolC family protein [Hymenobacter caeli]NRT19660.1 outer membrane protein [Hymenobacter caeli]